MPAFVPILLVIAVVAAIAVLALWVETHAPAACEICGEAHQDRPAMCRAPEDDDGPTVSDRRGVTAGRAR